VFLVVGHVGGGWPSQRPLVYVNFRLRSIRKMIMRDESPFLPTGTVLANIGRVDANLELEGRLVVGEREMVIAQSVVVRGGDSQRRGVLQ